VRKGQSRRGGAFYSLECLLVLKSDRASIIVSVLRVRMCRTDERAIILNIC
jgi:hypothetical protein